MASCDEKLGVCVECVECVECGGVGSRVSGGESDGRGKDPSRERIAGPLHGVIYGPIGGSRLA